MSTLCYHLREATWKGLLDLRLYTSVLVCFLCCDKTLIKNELEEGKGLTGLQVIDHHSGKPRQELEAEAETVEE